jgi:hypothetical protein
MRMRRPSPATVVALVALMLSAGGTVTAGVLVTSADIRDNTIRSADIHDEALNSRDVGNGAVGGVDVANNSLTGADVQESSLGRVPVANRLDGLDSTQFVRKTDPRTGHFSCAGIAFESSSDEADYTLDIALKFGEGPVPALFRCSATIPDGARVTEVSFSVKDTHASEDNECSMWRTNMTTAIGTEVAMADELTTTGAPADVRLIDTTIERAVIDNNRYSYFLQCWVGTDDATGLYGAIVTYTTTAGQAAGRPAVEVSTDRGGASSTDRAGQLRTGN